MHVLYINRHTFDSNEWNHVWFLWSPSYQQPQIRHQLTSVSVAVKTYYVLCKSFCMFFLFSYENNFILKICNAYGQAGAQHVSSSHMPWLYYICSSNTGFTLLHPKLIDDDDQFSSSEGSTVDGMAGGEGGQSVDFELEECMDPDACFPDGEHYYPLYHHLTYYNLGVNIILHITLVNHHISFVSAQAVCKSSSVVR